MKKEKQLKTQPNNCVHCPPSYTQLKMSEKIIAGFGTTMILKNKKVIYSEKPNLEWEDAPTLMKFENMARKSPQADWRYILNLPLRDAEYQRQGKNKWVLIKTGMGFA